MSGELLRERVSNGDGVDQHHNEKGEEIEAGNQATDLFTVIVINGAGDPRARGDVGGENKLAQRFMRPVG